MSIPLEILFHGIERSEAAEARIRDKFDRLHQHFNRITHARVVVETPRRHTPAAKVFQVKIEIGLPGQKPLIIRHDPPAEQTRTDIAIAIRDALLTPALNRSGERAVCFDATPLMFALCSHLAHR